MEGGHSLLGLRARRGRVLACGLLVAAGCAATSRVWADDPASLRSLAQRFNSPSNVFTEDENAVSLNQTVEPGQVYVKPVEQPPALGLEIVPPQVRPIRLLAPNVAATPSKRVFPDQENAVSPRRTVEPGQVYVKAVEPPPALGLEMVSPQVRPIRVAAPPVVAPAYNVVVAPAAYPVPPAPRVAPPAANVAVFVPPAANVTVPPAPPIALAVEAPAVVPQQVVMRDVEPPPLSLSVSEPPIVIPPPIIHTQAPGYARFDGSGDAQTDALQVAGLTVASADQPPPAPAAEGSGPSSGASSIATVDKLGDAPPTNSLAFLRQQALLLEPGKCQFDWGLTYSVFNDTFSLPIVNHAGTVVGVANERERLRLMTIPLAVRYGVCDGVQAYINAPLGWANSEETTDNGDSINNNFGGLGDLSAGFTFQLVKGCGAWCPDVVGSLGFVAPTGHATFATSLLASNSALGQGFWDITTNVIAVHTIDPILFYYGAGYVHRFQNTIDGIDVNPGEEFDYLFGVGFAANPWVTVSGTVLGANITRYGANGVSLPGTDQDPIRFRISVTVVKDQRICEPFAEIAMTPDSPSRVGVTFTY
jgi:hypothetical protein